MQHNSHIDMEIIDITNNLFNVFHQTQTLVQIHVGVCFCFTKYLSCTSLNSPQKGMGEGIELFCFIFRVQRSDLIWVMFADRVGVDPWLGPLQT